MSLKFKVLLPLFLIAVLVIAKYILWDFKISTGKRVGNLTKISKKGRILKTWEGTIDEGSGEQLTSYFSVKDEKLANELYNFEGRQVVLYYEQHVLGFPRETNYLVTSWKARGDISDMVKNMGESSSSSDSAAVNALAKTLFCSLLGSLYENKKLYNEVKEYIKTKNLYLYNQYEKCNE